MRKRILPVLSSINLRLFGALLLMGLMPAVYSAVRIFFLGQMPDGYAFSIAAQLQWAGLLYEIIQEAFILPLYFLIGNSSSGQPAVSGQDTGFSNKVRTGMLIVFCVYAVLSGLVVIFAEPLIRFMRQDGPLIRATVTYIRLEAAAAVFATLLRFVTVVFVTLKKQYYLMLIISLQTVLTVFLDTFLVSNLSVSAKLGVNGIAVANLIVNVLLLGLAVFLLERSGVRIFSKERLSFRWTKGWLRTGGVSGLESFVRNIAYMLMVVRMVNMVGEQGTFWVANSFIWGWLLLPVLQLGELVKRDVAESGREAVSRKTRAYFAWTTLIAAGWLVSVPLWKPFMSGVLRLSNADDVFFLVLVSMGPYVLFAYNNVIDSIFYGIGKTEYMLFQSVVINTLVYGGAFLLWRADVFTPTLTGIALLFASGTGLDSILTFFIFAWMLKKEKIGISPARQTASNGL